MCGIAGIFSNNKVLVRRISSMVESMKHRGPDEKGIWKSEYFSFGMSRLSILDVKNGSQPMWFKKIGLIFNGEIYNHKELRSKLINLGYKFNTHCDTEVFLKLYYHFKEKAFSYINGMFSVCILDLNKNYFLLARDRMGEKPLYYYNKDNTFIFASEIKSIIVSLGKKLNLNLESIDSFLACRFVLGNETIWSDIKKVSPASLLKFCLKTNKIIIKKYWQLNILSKKDSSSAQSKFNKLLINSVTLRQESSDFPVGILLSGGVDSSAILASMKKEKKKVQTYCVGFEDFDQNENKYSRILSKKFNTRHKDLFITKKEFLEAIDKQVYITDEPLADLTSIPLFYLFKEIKKDIKVILSGEGADELLGGYNFNEIYVKILKQEKSFFLFLKKFLLLDFLKIKIFDKKLKYISQIITKFFFSRHVNFISYVMDDKSRKKLWKKSYNFKNNFEKKLKNIFKASKSHSALDCILETYCKTWLVDDLLMRSDKTSMSSSVELRTPFLDYELVEFMSSLSNKSRFGENNKFTKKILRNYCKGLIPKSILNRKKQGFSIPIYGWLEDNDFNKELFKSLKRGNIEKFFNLDEISNIFKRSLSGNFIAQQQSWNLYILEKWLEVWKKNYI